MLAAVLLGLASLSCALQSLTSSDPIFTAPSGQEAASLTPLPLAALLDPPTATPTPASQTSQETPASEPTPTAEQIVVSVDETEDPALNTAPFLYYTQAGDTLPVVAVRFGVDPDEITSPDTIPETSLLNPGQLLIIPRRLANTTSSQQLMPDSEVVYSPSAVDFDITNFVDEAGGYLSSNDEWLKSTGITSGADVIYRVAIENSINPRILLSLLEYQTGWVYGQPESEQEKQYPLGRVEERYQGLYQQLTWAVNKLSIGYYGYREGRLTEIKLLDGVVARLAPDLNAGTAALQYFFAQFYDSAGWLAALDPETGFPALHERMFGSPWIRALTVEPLYPPDLAQPPLILPFQLDVIWGFTGGPHGAWERDGAFAAVDFAPGATEPGCVKTNAWAVASAAGQVVREGNGLVVLDMDGDGREQTGWVMLYLHIATKGKIALGEWVEAGDPLGHPSCEGGISTGTHIHIARKFNGEWIAADGPIPFVLSGWEVHAGENAYEGTLTRDGETVVASQLGIFKSRILRRAEDP